jgi:hypothetical protein
LGLVTHKLWISSRWSGGFARQKLLAPLATLAAHAATLGLVFGCWIFFRAQSLPAAGQILSGILTWKHTGSRLISPQILMAIAGVTLVHLCVSKDAQLHETLPSASPGKRIMVYSLLLILLAFLAITNGAPFIYFQF